MLFSRQVMSMSLGKIDLFCFTGQQALHNLFSEVRIHNLSLHNLFLHSQQIQAQVATHSLQSPWDELKIKTMMFSTCPDHLE